MASELIYSNIILNNLDSNIGSEEYIRAILNVFHDHVKTTAHHISLGMP